MINKSWKVKLPVIVGVAFLIMSLPFILRISLPSMHEGGYSAIYVIINVPALIAAWKIGNYVENILFEKLSIYQSILLDVFICLIFWMVVSFVVGIFIDMIKKNKKHV